MIDLIDGTQSHLCASAPKRAHERLAQLRAAVDRADSRRARQKLEREIDVCLNGAPYFRAASKRYMRGLIEGRLLPRLECLHGLLTEHIRRLQDAERES